MEPIIDIQNISKLYRIGSIQPYISLRDVIINSFKNPFSNKPKKEFLALEDVNLQIHAGERVGIIGHNGAGKSTLLKIISRITPPTKGKVIIKGKVASLLEVGTGFHPELTGRENIYLNGSILGLKKKEIDLKLDDIIGFSGVELFIDTPLKQYSTGMQLRLAFSVAAHLEPDILLIDEVLAVGDLEFQKKSIGKMEEVSSQEGRTILFVSHNLEAIMKFCSRVILLEKGKIVRDDIAERTINEYITSHGKINGKVSWNEESAPSDGNLRLLEVYTHTKKEEVKFNFYITDEIGISFTYEVLQENLIFTHGINVFNDYGVNVFDSHDNVSPMRMSRRTKGIYHATVWIPANLLPDGQFSVGVALFCQQPFHVFIHQLHVIKFSLLDVLGPESARGEFAGNYGGLVRPKLEWTSKKIN